VLSKLQYVAKVQPFGGGNNLQRSINALKKDLATI